LVPPNRSGRIGIFFPIDFTVVKPGVFQLLLSGLYRLIRPGRGTDCEKKENRDE
jgi:hypothetical protein